jgi:hypothetical protein
MCRFSDASGCGLAPALAISAQLKEAHLWLPCVEADARVAGERVPHTSASATLPHTRLCPETTTQRALPAVRRAGTERYTQVLRSLFESVASWAS